MIVVSALGPLDIRHEQRGSLATVLAQPRRAALLVYLVVEGRAGFVRRDALLAMFWPESDESRARAALRQALTFLRRSLGEQAIRIRGDDEVGIDPDFAASDVGHFRTSLSAGRDAQALALYRGDFLGGFAVDGAPDFERWCVHQRDSLAREGAACAIRLAERAANGSDWHQAVALGQRACSLDPFNESIHRRLLWWLDASGDRAGALRVHEEFRARLAQSLEVAPSPETDAVVQGIRERRTPRNTRQGDEIADAGADAGADVGAEAAPTRAAYPGAAAADNDTPPVPFNVPSIAPSTTPSAAPIAPSIAPSGSAAVAKRSAYWVVTGAAVVAAAVVAVVALFLSNGGPTTGASDDVRRAGVSDESSSHRRIVVIPLEEGGTGPASDASGARGAGAVDPSLGAMAADWITEGISRIEGVEVVPATAVLATRRSLEGASNASAPAAAASWQALAREVGAGVVVRGRIYRERGTVHLQAHVVDAQDGRILQPVERVSVPADSVMVGIDQLRTRVLAALAPIADTVTHLRRALPPPNYQAYRSYVRGLEAFVTGETKVALAHFRASAAADPNYPMPRIAASIALLNLNDPVAAERLLAPLLEERDRLGPLERATLDMVRGLSTGDLQLTYDAVVRQSRIAPGTIGEYMVAETARRMNRPAEAVAVLRRLGPERGELRGWRPYWRELTYALHLLGRHEEELAAARDARRRYPADAAMAGYEVRALAALGRAAEIAGALEDADGGAASTALRAALRLAAVTEWRVHSHPRGDSLLGAVSAWFDSLPAELRRTPSMRRQEARVRMLEGKGDAASEVLAPLLRPASGVELPTIPTLALAGVAAAARGDSAMARALMARIERHDAARPAAERGASWGEATYWRAVVAAQLSDSLGALSLLRDARREGLGVDPSVHAEPAFSALRRWPPFAVLLQPTGP